MKKRFVRIFGIFLLLDGFFTFLFGRKFVRLFRVGPESSLFRKVIEKLLNISPLLLRTSGGAEAALGFKMIAKESLDVQTLYNSLAGGYAAIDPGWREWFYQPAHKAFDRAITQHLRQGGTILDLGCGTGGNLARLLLLNIDFEQYTGVDLTEGMLAQARNRYGHIAKADFFQLDLMSDPIPEGDYDLVVSTWAIEHLSNPITAVEKAWQQLKPGGHMVLLFEIEGDSLKSRIYEKIYPFFSAVLVPIQVIHSFPGVISIDRFTGILADLALVIVEKADVPS